MAELETQLRQYTKGVLDHVEPVRADEITTEEHLPRGRRGRTRGAVAVAASVLLIASGALWIISRGGGDQVRVTSRSGAFPSPTQWMQTGVLDTELGTITSVPGGIVATGYGGIWFSPDARQWTNVLTPEGALTQPSYVNDVVSTGHGLVAVGRATDLATGQGVAAVWTTPDGRTWTRVRDAALAPSTPPIPQGDSSPDRGSIAAVTRGGPGLIAVGEVFSGQFDGPTLVTSCCSPTVWTSHDGSRWARIDQVGDGGGAFVDVVARKGTAFAFAGTVNGTAVSASNDGTHWQHVGTVRGSVSSVTVHGATLVAAGSEPAANQNARASIWTSRNGVTWRRAFAAPAARITSYTSVASNGHWLVAVGYRGRYEVTTPGVMAISKDGIHWVAVHRDGGVFARHAYLESVTAVGQGFATLGTESSGDGTAGNPVRGHTVVFGANITPSRAATSTRTLHDGASTLRDLAARPLHARQLPANEVCPQATVTNHINGVGPAVEVGPIAATTGSDPPGLQFGKAEPLRSKSGVSRGGWHGAKVLWLVRVEQPAAVIVRGTRIDGIGAVRWAHNGTSPALALTSDATSSAPPEWRDIPSAAMVRGSGCYAFQIDGTNFQSTLILRAEPGS